MFDGEDVFRGFLVIVSMCSVEERFNYMSHEKNP